MKKIQQYNFENRRLIKILIKNQGLSMHFTILAVAQGDTSSSFAACKFVRRKCHPDCLFAPPIKQTACSLLPSNNPQKFVHVHCLLAPATSPSYSMTYNPINSIACKANIRLCDLVYYCFGVVSILQYQLWPPLCRGSQSSLKYQPPVQRQLLLAHPLPISSAAQLRPHEGQQNA